MSRGWGTPPWEIELELPSLEPPASSEVAVVGAGLCGLATALELARLGAEVTLLDAGRIGAGASGRTGGLILEDSAAGPLPGLGPCIPALQRAIELCRIECDLELRGCWELVHDDRAPLWRDGETALSVAELVPGGSLNPGKLIAGLARAARDAGVAICESAPVSSLKPGALVARGRTVAVRSVCLALNAYTPTLCPDLDELSSALSLALLTRPISGAAMEAIGLSGGQVFYTRDLPYLWGRPLGKRLLLGSGLSFDPEGRLERIEVGRGEAAERLDAFECRIRELHPALGEVCFERRWGGPVAFRPARAPLLFREESAGAIVTGAFAGHGVALSFAIAAWIADAIWAARPLPEWGLPQRSMSEGGEPA